MSHSAVLKAAKTLPRANPADIAAFAKSPVGNIVDALGRTGAMAASIKPVTTATTFAGTALTVDAGPRDNLAPWASLRLAKPGDVLIIATGGHTAHAVAGDILIGMAKNAGIIAIVTDGAVRDIAGNNAAGIPVFAAAITPNSPQKNGPGSVGLPIVCGGVATATGDIVCGDDEGVVIIPAARIKEAKTALEAVKRKEAAMEAELAAGAPAPGWLRDIPLDDLFTFTD
ncbi:MAG: RraA family protein [Pseudomonadota bacterium]